MVIVEFFSRNQIENMIGTFANRPERVVFVGVLSVMRRSDETFRRFLAATGNTLTQIEYRGIRLHELSEIVKVLTRVVEDYPGCCFDLTGGDDLTMVAIGIVFERYREKGLELHQFNIRSGQIYDTVT